MRDTNEIWLASINTIPQLSGNINGSGNHFASEVQFNSVISFYNKPILAIAVIAASFECGLLECGISSEKMKSNGLNR